MLISIITINRNDSSGLEKTLTSVASQTAHDFEYVVIDGNSNDSSVEVINKYEAKFATRIKWISEPDSGIYNAMNKGIAMATGEYVQFLNSGDTLTSDDIIGRMQKSLEENNYPSILYGNMIKVFPDGREFRDKSFAGSEISMLGFYTGTLNHSPALIKRSLFEKYGKYDESLRIVSDWKWYLQAIIFGGEKPVYTDIDVTRFDMTGISETNKDLDKQERQKVLSELIPAAILSDYNNYSFAIDQYKRLKRHPWAYKICWFIERCLFKIEKRQRIKSGETQYK